MHTAKKIFNNLNYLMGFLDSMEALLDWQALNTQNGFRAICVCHKPCVRFGYNTGTKKFTLNLNAT